MKSFKQYYLTEDEESDRKYRRVAATAFKRIKKAIDKAGAKGTWGDLFYFSARTDTLIITPEKSPLGSDSPEIRFAPESGRQRGLFGFSSDRPGEPVIVLYMIDDETTFTERIGVWVNYINRNIDNYKDSFIHEYIHYLDWERTGGYTIDTVHSDGEGVVSIEDYVNNPTEFNAHYQELISRIMNEAEQLVNELESGKIFVEDNKVKSWVKTFVNVETEKFVKNAMLLLKKFFVENLNSKYRKKLEKRLARFHTKTLKSMFKNYV